MNCPRVDVNPSGAETLDDGRYQLGAGPYAGLVRWLPLSKRNDPEQAKTYDALHEGVPEWLAGPVARWIFETFRSMNYEVDLRNNLDLLYGMLRRPMPLRDTDGFIEDLANGAAGGDLDILDAIVWLTDTYAGGWTQRDRLNLLLLVHGSAWTVGTSEADQPCLERRVDETTTAAAKAEMEEVGIHLRRAWHRVYGKNPDKNPDAGGAYREAVRAGRGRCEADRASERPWRNPGEDDRGDEGQAGEVDGGARRQRSRVGYRPRHLDVRRHLDFSARPTRYGRRNRVS